MRTCPRCSSDVAAGPACPTCGDLQPAPPFSIWPILKFIGGLGLVTVVLALAIPAFLHSSRASGERGRTGSLKMLASAEADFRSNDRDGNRVQDFWTGDVAGLYCIIPGPGSPGAGEPIKLVELSVAGSDSDPLRPPAPPYTRSITSLVRPAPRSGYWLWALRADASENPPDLYRRDTQGEPSAGAYYHTSKFGFLAFPESPSTGRHAFIINEGNTVFKRPVDASIRPIRADPPGRVTHPGYLDWPSDAVLGLDWSRMD